MVNKNIISIENGYKSIENNGIKKEILDNINIKISEGSTGSITSIVAPFKNGKTTLLKIVSGLEQLSSGKIERKVDFPFIPEDPSSFPWMNVKQNIQFTLSIQNKDISLFNKYVEMTGLKGYEDFIPDAYSYGFRFRIALARALAAEKELICIDDCFRSMDGETKEEIFFLFLSLKKLGKNFLFATTNITEALIVSDKIVLMGGKPAKIFHEIAINRDEIEDRNTIKANYLVNLRNEIEEKFKEEQIINHVNLSI
jgi:NitT/TauT family transport system ATP-binding protein